MYMRIDTLCNGIEPMRLVNHWVYAFYAHNGVDDSLCIIATFLDLEIAHAPF